MGWKKLIFGEKMPDKDDPKYKKQYDEEVRAGRETAKVLGVDKAAKKTQRFAIKYPRLFLVLVFGFVICCLGFNVYRMVRVYNQPSSESTATSRQDERLRQKMKNIHSEDKIFRNRGAGKEAVEQEYSVQEVKAMEERIESLLHKEEGMSHEDSLMVKRLLEKLVQSNNLKSK